MAYSFMGLFFAVEITAFITLIDAGAGAGLPSGGGAGVGAGLPAGGDAGAGAGLSSGGGAGVGAAFCCVAFDVTVSARGTAVSAVFPEPEHATAMRSTAASRDSVFTSFNKEIRPTFGPELQGLSGIRPQ